MRKCISRSFLDASFTGNRNTKPVRSLETPLGGARTSSRSLLLLQPEETELYPRWYRVLMESNLRTEATFIPPDNAPPTKQKGDAQRKSPLFSLLRGNNPVECEMENVMKREVGC
jgi:hypothetical protein